MSGTQNMLRLGEISFNSIYKGSFVVSTDHQICCVNVVQFYFQVEEEITVCVKVIYRYSEYG